MFPEVARQKLQSFTIEALKETEATIFSGCDAGKIADSCGQLFSKYPQLQLEYTEIGYFHRARLLSDVKSFQHVKDMLWPKSTETRLNRANDKASQVVYFSNHLHSAVEEIRPSARKSISVQSISCSLLKDRRVKISPVGEMYHVVRTGQSRLGDPKAAQDLTHLMKTLSDKDSLKLLYLDAVILKAFNSPNRMISSAIARELFKRDGSEAVIAFASQKHYGALNYVMEPEYFLNNFGLVGGLHCNEVICHGHGLLDMHATKFLSSVSKFGKFKWSVPQQAMTESNTYFGPVRIKSKHTNK